MAGETEMADNHFHSPTPTLVLPHLIFSLIFWTLRQFLLQNQIWQLLLHLLPHLHLLLQLFFGRKLRLYLVFSHLQNCHIRLDDKVKKRLIE